MMHIYRERERRRLNRLGFANDFGDSFGGVLEDVRGDNCIHWHIRKEVQGWHFFLSFYSQSQASAAALSFYYLYVRMGGFD
jgi:hypothetical protein